VPSAASLEHLPELEVLSLRVEDDDMELKMRGVISSYLNDSGRYSSMPSSSSNPSLAESVYFSMLSLVLGILMPVAEEY
jgi:hypothetical protein